MIETRRVKLFAKLCIIDKDKLRCLPLITPRTNYQNALQYIACYKLLAIEKSKKLDQPKVYFSTERPNGILQLSSI